MTFAALDGLDDVDWTSVHHAYGEAGDVPRLLREAVGPDEEAAREALEELASSITHQGTLYTATPVAVPFLIALAGGPDVPRRRRILWQLCMIAESEDAGPEVLEAVRGALEAGAERLVALLDDPDVDVRQAAGFVVGHLPAGHVPLDALRRREAEDDGSVAAGLLAAAEAGEVLVAARTAAAHGMPLDGLVPALREIARLDVEGFEAREERIEAVGFLLDATGETGVPLLAAGQVLARGRQVAERAAALAGRLGPAAAELAPALREQARDPYFGFGAALALRRIDGSTGPLLDAVRARLERLGPGPWLPEAVEALGAAAAGLLPELDALAEGDRSAVGTGTAGTMIEADDRLREMLAGVRSRLAP
ncbi:hypothetical protein ACQEU3_04235 [Spirillospora sp. CA-253888]